MARFRAVVFDLFDTLVDLSMANLPRVEVAGRSVPTTLGLLHEVVRERAGIPFDAFVAELRMVDKTQHEARYRDGVEVPTQDRMRALLRGLSLEQDPDLVEELTWTHMDALRDQVTPHPHHVGVLEELRARGLKIGLCSNFTHSATAEKVLEEAGLRGLLDVEIVSDAVGFRKPRAEIFDATLTALDLPAEQVLHVGDNLDADVKGASARGIATVWITRRVEDRVAALARSPGARPDHEVADLADLADLPGLDRG